MRTTTSTTGTLRWFSKLSFCVALLFLPLAEALLDDLFEGLGKFLCLPLPFLPSCNLPWPNSPLLSAPTNDPNWIPPATLEDAKAAIVGHYAHFDVVAYVQDQFTGPFRTLIVSYGFTDFELSDDGELIQVDSFCFSEYKANTPFETSVGDALTQAILPRTTVVDVTYEESDGSWQVYRPPTPTLLGIAGDASLPLSSDPNDPNIIDPDEDGNPGVTVDLLLYGFLPVNLYIARREIFQTYKTLYSDGSLRGYVIDDSEQLRIGTTFDLLFDLAGDPYDYPLQERENLEGLNPVVLTPTSVTSCDELKAQRDTIFPPSPEF